MIILGIILVAAVAFIFLLIKVLKNTYENFEFKQMVTNIQHGIAYDGNYYPCNLLLGVYPAANDTRQICDFSLYDSNHIVGYCVYSDEFAKEDYGEHIVPNVIMFQPIEGVWLWKFAP